MIAAASRTRRWPGSSKPAEQIVGSGSSNKRPTGRGTDPTLVQTVHPPVGRRDGKEMGRKATGHIKGCHFPVPTAALGPFPLSQILVGANRPAGPLCHLNPDPSAFSKLANPGSKVVALSGHHPASLGMNPPCHSSHASAEIGQVYPESSLG